MDAVRTIKFLLQKILQVSKVKAQKIQQTKSIQLAHYQETKDKLGSLYQTKKLLKQNGPIQFLTYLKLTYF